jgi:hypothetical protein
MKMVDNTNDFKILLCSVITNELNGTLNLQFW